MSEPTAPPTDAELHRIEDRARFCRAGCDASVATAGLVAEIRRLRAELAEPDRARQAAIARALHEHADKLTAVPCDATALTGPVWYGAGWRDAADHLHLLADIAEPSPWPKLVRDGVPAVIRANGAVRREPRFHVADDAEYRDRLLAKLTEEADEARGATDDDALRGELADLLEVVLALAGVLPGGAEGLWREREGKLAERGGLGGRVVWDGYADRAPKPPCPSCGGTASRIVPDPVDPQFEGEEPCRDCDGNGRARAGAAT